jgi:N-glycosidase YbiA
MAIYFYRVHEPYGCFSNFSPHSVVLKGQRWATAEHYYQAQKFVGTTDAAVCQAIWQAATPEQAAALGRNPRHCLRPDWEQVKIQVMREAVLKKFQTHLDIQEILLSTGEEWLIENSPVDTYWGCGSDHTGQNQLGRILMAVRQELRSALAHSSLLSNG